jgi:putative membrane protein
MTKDVELHSSTWKTMKQAITGLTENATVSSSGYGNYTNAQAGSYSTGTASTGFAKRVEDLVKISEKVQKLIKEKDTDGVVSYTYHDETSTAQTLQAKLSTLERYAENVNTYIKKNIDRPFYEAMDKVGAKLEALNIQQYKTTNKIGYKRIESVKDPYGHPVGTKEVTPPEIGIDELYKVDSPYKASLKKSYEEYRKSKDYKDHRLTETEYVQVMHQTRSFEYVSIDDEKSTTEMWRDLTLTAATVVLFVFCPPAGAVLSTVAATAEMYSAASGKDWGTGRELDGNERAMRGAFALLDLIPAGKYLSGLAKTGKTAGLTAVKTSIKTAVKEGIEQGAKNFDTFKGLLKNVKGMGDNIFSQIKTFGKQLDNLRPSKILSNSADALSDGLRHADNVLGDAAQRFSLNSLEQLQPVTGSIPFEGGKLSHLADNLSAFAKNLDGSVEELSENTVKFFEKPLSTIDRFNEIDIVSYAETMKKNYTEIDVAKLTDLTTHNTESKTALLGYFQPNSVTSYEQVAHANGWTYFDAGSNGWNAMWKVDPDLAYKVNDEFLLKQIQEGKNFILSSNPETADFVFHTTGKGESFMNEMNILRENGYKFENFGNMWRAYK